MYVHNRTFSWHKKLIFLLAIAIINGNHFWSLGFFLIFSLFALLIFALPSLLLWFIITITFIIRCRCNCYSIFRFAYVVLQWWWVCVIQATFITVVALGLFPSQLLPMYNHLMISEVSCTSEPFTAKLAYEPFLLMWQVSFFTDSFMFLHTPLLWKRHATKLAPDICSPFSMLSLKVEPYLR